MGNTDGVSRSTSNSTSLGSCALAWFTRACTRCRASCMSLLGAKYTWISLAPRMEREVTRCTPGTMLTASSMGRVTLKTTWRAPSEVPCATTVMRGKRSSG